MYAIKNSEDFVWYKTLIEEIKKQCLNAATEQRVNVRENVRDNVLETEEMLIIPALIVSTSLYL